MSSGRGPGCFGSSEPGFTRNATEPGICILVWDLPRNSDVDLDAVGRYGQAYSESNLHDLPLSFGVGRRWPDVASNVASPGWVQTRMVGAGTPDDLDQAHLTQAWLAVGDDQEARRSGGVFYHRRPADMHPAACDPELQDCLLDYCRERSGVAPA